MKVLHIINTLSAGGAELHLLTLSRFLKGQGVDVAVACFREHVKGSRSLRPDFEKENIRVINLDADSRYNVRFLGRLLNVIKKEHADILHSHLPRADIATAFISRLVRSPAFVCSVHGIYRDRWFGTWAAPFMRLAYQRADAVIAISSAVKEWLLQDFTIAADKIEVIHYGIEAEQFVCSDKHSESDTQIETSYPIVGSIGRLEPGKGFDCLIRAMGIVRKTTPQACLQIAGHDPLGYGENLQSLIAEMALNENVRLVGFQKDVPSFLHGVNIFAFASRTEGFGQVVVEAMASGRPVVVSNIAPLTEIVRHGETGFLAQVDDPDAFAGAIDWLLKHPDQAIEMGKRGQAWVHKHFSVQRMANATLSLYASLTRIAHQQLKGPTDRKTATLNI